MRCSVYALIVAPLAAKLNPALDMNATTSARGTTDDLEDVGTTAEKAVGDMGLSNMGEAS